ncbi:hypothetical protein D3C71_1071740 [compost metagenome]
MRVAAREGQRRTSNGLEGGFIRNGGLDRDGLLRINGGMHWHVKLVRAVLHERYGLLEPLIARLFHGHGARASNIRHTANGVAPGSIRSGCAACSIHGHSHTLQGQPCGGIRHDALQHRLTGGRALRSQRHRQRDGVMALHVYGEDAGIKTAGRHRDGVVARYHTSIKSGFAFGIGVANQAIE